MQISAFPFETRTENHARIRELGRRPKRSAVSRETTQVSSLRIFARGEDVFRECAAQRVARASAGSRGARCPAHAPLVPTREALSIGQQDDDRGRKLAGRSPRCRRRPGLRRRPRRPAPAAGLSSER